MNIKLNGLESSIDSSMSLSEVVEINLKGKEAKGVAVALNEKIIPKHKWESTLVSENDSVEIVHAVQGG
jgi:sulfur carrier protein